MLFKKIITLQIQGEFASVCEYYLFVYYTSLVWHKHG